MEAACGEYGDKVPTLVVALKAGKCAHFQSLKKLTNCEKENTVKGRDAFQNTTVSLNQNANSVAAKANHLVEDLDIKETAILDDNLSETEADTLSMLSNSERVPMKVVVNGQNGACDTSLAKESDVSIKQ